MAKALNASYALTSRYAKALIDLAQDSGKTSSIEKDLREFLEMAKVSNDLVLLISTPSVGRRAQAQAVMALAEKAKFNIITKNFLGVLVKNGRLGAVEAIINAFMDELAKRRGEVTVKVETAQDLTPAQLKNLKEALSKDMKGEVTIQAKVEPSIMGGMIVTAGSRMIDDSVRSKLERLKRAMSRQANENLTNNHEDTKSRRN